MSGRDRLALGLLGSLLVLACGAQDLGEASADGSGGTSTGGAISDGGSRNQAGSGQAGALEDGGSSGAATELAGAAGAAGTGAGTGNAGAGIGGAGGMNVPPTGMGGGSDVKPLPCPGSYDPGAPWPGGGRCADRGGLLPRDAPHAFSTLAIRAVGTPVSTTPVIGHKHLFVATALGVFRLDRQLEATGAPIARLSGNYAAAPVVTAKHVYAVSTDGILHWASQDGDEGEQTLSLQAEGGASTNWSTAPLLGEEMLVVASPSGRIIRVTLGDPPTVLKATKTSGGATEGSVAADGEGAIYLPTNIGVYRLPKTAGALQFFGSAPVSQTPIGTASGAVFLDDGGTLHAVRLATSATEPVPTATSVSGAKLTTQRGPLASVDGFRFVVASDKSLQRITVNDSDDTKGPVLDSVGGGPLFSATAPIAAAPAVDSSGVLFVASTDGVLYVVDPSGDILDSYLTDGALVAQPALSESAVYVGSLDGNVYRFGAEAGGAAGSAGGGSAGMGGSSGTSGSAGTGGAQAPAGGSAGSN